jgi:4-amino-4-deoxy-L-arabinose transferase-like glycosyltransferase
VGFAKFDEKGLSLRGPNLRLLLLGVLLLAGLCLRLFGIEHPPMDLIGVRQYHGALLARGFYEWLLTGNLKTIPPDGIIEPPIIELLASLSYLISGGEHLWIPRVLSACFWMVGGFFLYLIASKIVSPNAALFSVAFYLFDPAVVLTSRAFMPDPLMIMLLMVSVYTILRYHEHPTTSSLLVAVVGSSMVLFVKPGICLFQVFGAFIALMVYRKGLIRTLSSAHLYLFTLLTLLPMGLYYAGFLQGAAAHRIAPELLLSHGFWRGWLLQIEYMVGYVALAGALLGVLLLRPGTPRALTAGMWSGYFLFGLVFAHHVSTHDYYSLQLIPIVALSLGSLWDFLVPYLWRTASARHQRVTIAGVFLSILALSAVEQSKTILLIAQQGQGEAFPGKYVAHGTIADYERRAQIYREIGEIVNHSPKAIVYAPDYGYSLAYHGRLDGRLFLYPESKTVREDFEDRYEESSPRYAIIIKRFAYYPRQVDWGGGRKTKKHEGLRPLLTKKFDVVVKEDAYIVFDLREPGVGRSKATR